MADIRVNFLHPTDGRILTVTLDETMTADEVIGELIANDFIAPNPQGYNLTIKGGKALASGETFLEADTKDDDTIRVIPATDAGGGPRPTHTSVEREAVMDSAIPGLQKKSTDKFTVEDIQNSPAALVMIVNLFDNLQVKYEKQTNELEIEKARSHSRFLASLLLLVSQVILAIGANLLTANKPIAIPVLIAGGIQAFLAIFLTFRKPKKD